MENSGAGKTYHETKPSPKTVLDPPPMVRFPPHLFTPCHFFGGSGHRPDKSHFLWPPKVALEGALYSTFSSSQKIVRCVLPPPLAISQTNSADWQTSIWATNARFDVVNQQGFHDLLRADLETQVKGSWTPWMSRLHRSG